MTDILFGQSYYLRFDPKLWAAQQPYPPLGTLYAAAVMRRAGYDVALFDAMLAESEAEWAAALDAHQPRFAVIYEDNFNYLTKMCLLRMRQAAFTMSAMAAARGYTVIVAGSDASDHSAAYLSAGAHYVLLGEGEATLLELIDRLAGRTTTPLSDIAGLAHCADGRPHANPRRPPIADVDALPFPAWDLVDVERYRHLWRERHGAYSMNMVTTRGCPYHCNWCAKPIWGQRYHSRSPECVAAEMRWLKETYAPDHIWFADDIMGLKPGWWARFAEAVEARDARLPFKCLSRADLIMRNEADVAALARAGADIVWLGAESGSQRILNAMEKGTTVEQIRDAAQRLHEAGVRVGFFLQFGYPGETRDDIEATLQLVRDGRPDDIGMSVSYPLPGTKFHTAVRAQLSAKQNWIDSADLDMLYEGPFSTAFYRQLHGVLHKEFRARRALDEARRVAAHPAQWRPAHVRALAGAAYRRATLPAARARLNRLADAPPTAVRPPIHMSLEEAARPTPQEEEEKRNAEGRGGARRDAEEESIVLSPPNSASSLRVSPRSSSFSPDSMQESHYDNVAEAFSRKSTIYDAFGENHANMARMRRKFYDHVAAVMPAGGRLLEINAGTGQDAVELVRRGFRVHATDFAPGMIAAIEEKRARLGLGERLTVEALSFTDLDRLAGGPFDGLISNSGGLNCIADLTAVTRHLPRLLRPGARATVVVMPRICPWELAVIPKDARVGTRRLRPGGILAHVEGVHFMTYYFSAAAVRRAFGPRFRPLRQEGLSVFTPTADNKTFAVNHPRLFDRLVRLDDALAPHWPFNGWGDFFILTMEFLG